MDPLERLRSWSYRRQLLDRSGQHALRTLEEVIGVYSTHPTAPLALLARCSALARDDVPGMDQRRETVRLPAMRGSAFMLPAHTVGRVFSAVGPPREKHEQRVRGVGLDVATYDRLTPLALECASTPVTRIQLRKCAKTDEDVHLVLRLLAREGKVLRLGGGLRTDQLKYVATEAWLGHPLDAAERTEALAWLAGEYLRAFGPARVVDFAWWAGVPRVAAAAAIDRHPTVEIFDGLLLPEEDRAAFEAVTPLEPDAIAVLPKWDSYTMGYAPDGRRRFVDDQHLALAYTGVQGSPGATAGDGNPLILRGGRAMASWSQRFTRNAMSATIVPFEGAQRVMDVTFDAIGDLLSASKIEVTIADQDRSLTGQSASAGSSRSPGAGAPRR